ncbi:hypothetical protein M0Q03_00335 [bacterium]|jgi:hypothetical protein|nr:hypothetical protein [bacterium]
MQKVNNAFDNGDIEFLYEEVKNLRISKAITEDQEQILRDKICNIQEIYDFPEEVEALSTKLKKGEYFEVVNEIIKRAREKGIFHTVIVPDSSKKILGIKMIPYKATVDPGDIYEDEKNVSGSNDERKERGDIGKRENSSINDRLRDIERMMTKINERKEKSFDDMQTGVETERKMPAVEEKVTTARGKLLKSQQMMEEIKRVQEISNLDFPVNVVSFGSKQQAENVLKKDEKNIEFMHRRLKEWTASEVKNDPISFISDVLNNINRQIELKREIKLPKRALGVVFQLLQREYSKNEEYSDRKSNRDILDEARENLLGGDVEKILNELKNAEDLFRIDSIFRAYIKGSGVGDGKKSTEGEIGDTILLGDSKKGDGTFVDNKVSDNKKEFYFGGEIPLSEIIRTGAKGKNKKAEGSGKKLNIIGTTPLTENVFGDNEPNVGVNKVVRGGTIPVGEGNEIKETSSFRNSELLEKKRNDIIRMQDALKNIPLSDNGIKAEDVARYSGSIEDKGEKSDNIEKLGVEGEGAESGKLFNEGDELRLEAKQIYFEMIRDLVDLDIKIEDIKKERIRQERVSVRLGIRKSKESELENEYRKTQDDYRNLRKKIVEKSGLGEDEIDEKIISMRRELGQMKSRFNKEKAGEYIQHLKKIVEYQKDSLPEKKKILFEKIVTTIKDKRAQIIISALLLGISIAIPATGGASWLTHGIVSGFLPEELGMPLKYLGTATGGYLFGNDLKPMLEARKLKIVEIEKRIVEKINNFVYPKVNSINDFSVDDDYVIKNATFFNKFQKLEAKNNFIKAKKQIIES